MHTNDIGAAIEAGIDAGRPRNVRVTDLFEQVERRSEWVRRRGRSSTSTRRGAGRHDRGRRGRRRRRRPALAHEPRRAARRRGRAVDEPVDRADPRSGRSVQRRRGRRAAEQQEHRARSRARSTTSPRSTSSSCRPRALSRRSPRSSATTPTPTSTPMSTAMNDALTRVRTGEVTQAVRDAVAECGPIPTGRLDRVVDDDGIVAATASPADAVLTLLGDSSTTTARSSPCSSVATRVRPTRSASASTSSSRTRTSRSSSTTAASRCTRTSSAWSNRARCRRAIRRSPCAISREIAGRAASIGSAPRSRNALAEMGLHTVLDVLQHYPRRFVDRTKRADIAELAVGEEATVFAEVQRVHGRRTRQGRALVEVVVYDGTSTAERHVLQPGVAREAIARRYRSRVLRQGRRVPREAPDDEPRRRRHRPAGRGRREDRRDRADLPAVGQGRDFHVAVAQARRRRRCAVAGPRARRPARRRRPRPITTSSTATPRSAAIHQPETMRGARRGRGAG